MEVVAKLPVTEQQGGEVQLLLKATNAIPHEGEAANGAAGKSNERRVMSDE